MMQAMVLLMVMMMMVVSTRSPYLSCWAQHAAGRTELLRPQFHNSWRSGAPYLSTNAMLLDQSFQEISEQLSPLEDKWMIICKCLVKQ